MVVQNVVAILGPPAVALPDSERVPSFIGAGTGSDHGFVNRPLGPHVPRPLLEQYQVP